MAVPSAQALRLTNLPASMCRSMAARGQFVPRLPLPQVCRGGGHAAPPILAALATSPPLGACSPHAIGAAPPLSQQLGGRVRVFHQIKLIGAGVWGTGEPLAAVHGDHRERWTGQLSMPPKLFPCIGHRRVWVGLARQI